MSDELKNLEDGAPKTEPTPTLTEPELDQVVGGVVTGKHITTATITCRKAGENPQE
jgi:hypothetical protein